MNIGEKIPTREFIEYLDFAGVKSGLPDADLDQVVKNIDEFGWVLDHAAYKPRFPLFHKDEPGFNFVIKDPDNERVAEIFAVPYGPKSREFVLEKTDHIYYIRNIPFWKRQGFSEERLYSL